MKSMIVSGSVAIGAGLDPDPTKDDIVDLTSGSITISRSDTNELVRYAASGDVFNSDFKKDTRLHIIQGLGNGNIISSPVINPHTLTIEKQSYVAAVAKVVDLGRTTSGGGTGSWNLPDPAKNVGRYATIRVTNTSADINSTGASNNQFTVEHLIGSGDTAETIHSSLLAKLQKKAGKFYSSVSSTKSGTDYGFKFTGKLGYNFRVQGEDLLHGCDVTIVTNFNQGKGIGSILAIDEKNFASRKGYNQTYYMREELFDSSQLFIDPSGTYVVYTLKWTNPHEHILAAGDDPFIVETQVCIPSGATATIAQMDSVISAISDQSVSFAA